MALIVNVPTGQVEGQFVVGVVDGDGENSKPRYLPARGQVVFTATAPYVPNPVASPNPVTMLKKPVVALLDNEGYLCTPTLMNPELAGRRGIRLAATDNASDSVKGWTWEATPRFVDEDGATIPGTIPTFTFALPGDSTVDLTTVVKVPASTGIGEVQTGALAAAAQAAARAAAADALTAKASAADAVRVATSARDEIPGLVSQAVASDPGVAGAAAVAVTDELKSRDLIEGSDLRVPEINNAPATATEPLAAAVVDSNRRMTWLAARASDGGPSKWSMSMLNDRMGYSQVPGYHQILFSVLDAQERMTDLTVRASDGQLADFVIERLRKRLKLSDAPVSVAPQFAPGDRHVRGGEVLPVLADPSRISGWGSSSMEGIGWAPAAIPPKGTTFHKGGKGGETASQIAARVGSVPPLVTVEGGIIPAAVEAVKVTAPNITANASLRPFTGTLNGVPGTFAWTAGSTSFTFTRTTAGVEVAVTPGTPFISTLGATYRNAVTLLWMGKNDLGNTTGADDKVIQLTDATYDWLSPLIKRTLVIGHFVNGGTAAGATVRKQILAVNAAHQRRYGDLYLDVQDYLTGPQVWTDTKITPTAEDLAEQALGNKPPSISNDTGHLNNAGYAAVWNLILARFRLLGWY